MDQPGNVANPAPAQLGRENLYPTVHVRSCEFRFATSQHEFPCRVGLLISLLRLVVVLTSLRVDSITVRLYMIYFYRHSFKYTMRNEINNLRRTYTLGREFDPGKRDFSRYRTKKQMPNGRRTIIFLLHQIRLHGRRGKRLAESFSRERLTHAPQKELDEKYRRTSLLCDSGWYVQRFSCPEWLGRKQHTHTQSPYEKKRKRQWFKQNSETPKELHLTNHTRENKGYYHVPSSFRLSFYSYFPSRSGIQLCAVVHPSLLPRRFHIKCSALFRTLRPSASFTLLLGWSRPLIGVDAENTQVVQEHPIHSFSCPPHTARVRHHDALRGDVQYLPWAIHGHTSGIRHTYRFPDFHNNFICVKSPRCSYLIYCVGVPHAGSRN